MTSGLPDGHLIMICSDAESAGGHHYCDHGDVLLGWARRIEECGR